MLHIHANARTTCTRAEILRSVKFSNIVAYYYGISAETMCKWCEQGVADCFDRSAQPHQLPPFSFQPPTRLKP